MIWLWLYLAGQQHQNTVDNPDSILHHPIAAIISLIIGLIAWLVIMFFLCKIDIDPPIRRKRPKTKIPPIRSDHR
jgi:hypothetical protein